MSTYASILAGSLFSFSFRSNCVKLYLEISSLTHVLCRSVLYKLDIFGIFQLPFCF